MFQDDIIVVGKTVEKHNNGLKKLLNVSSEVGLRVKQNKCSFLKNSMIILGHWQQPYYFFLHTYIQVETIFFVF